MRDMSADKNFQAKHFAKQVGYLHVQQVMYMFWRLTNVLSLLSHDVRFLCTCTFSCGRIVVKFASHEIGSISIPRLKGTGNTPSRSNGKQK